MELCRSEPRTTWERGGNPVFRSDGSESRERGMRRPPSPRCPLLLRAWATLPLRGRRRRRARRAAWLQRHLADTSQRRSRGHRGCTGPGKGQGDSPQPPAAARHTFVTWVPWGSRTTCPQTGSKSSLSRGSVGLRGRCGAQGCSQGAVTRGQGAAACPAVSAGGVLG